MKDVSKRRQIRIDKKEDEKNLISLWKKKMKLLEGKRSLNKVELPKPERWGYKRFFILRDDIARSKDSSFYKQLLVHIQNIVLSRDKKFEYKDYKTKKRLPIQQELKPIDHKDWNYPISNRLVFNRYGSRINMEKEVHMYLNSLSLGCLCFVQNLII